MARLTADYSISKQAMPCEGFENVGVVRDGSKGEVLGKDKLLPWIAKATEDFVKLDDRINWIPVERHAIVPGGGAVQVKGLGHWMNGASRGACGSLATSFNTERGSSYLVEILWNHIASCFMRVSDVTNPAQPRPVAAGPDRCARGG